VVPYIHVAQDVLVKRLAKRAEIEGRADDNEETIRTRMQVYESETAPLLDYYENRGLLVKINGEQSIDQVSADLTAVIRQEMLN
jgi:adenylate kinase